MYVMKNWIKRIFVVSLSNFRSDYSDFSHITHRQHIFQICAMRLRKAMSASGDVLSSMSSGMITQPYPCMVR